MKSTAAALPLPLTRFSFLLAAQVIATWAVAGVSPAADPAVAEPAAAETAADPEAGKLDFTVDLGKYHFTIDSTESPSLQQWAAQELQPVIAEWYPTIVHMLPGKDFAAPTEIKIKISDQIEGVAYTQNSSIYCNGVWFQRNLAGEAKGAVVHELVHVVQAYRNGRRGNRPPGWVVEGIADFIRWYLYEPESGGALIPPRRAANARYNASYRTSANFLNWVSINHGANFVPKLNARVRSGKYNNDFWVEQTGKPVEQLAEQWKASLAEDDGQNESTETQNLLTAEEKQQGWKLLFDGQSTAGWHSFKRDQVLPGWKVQDGALVCHDPSQAGDLCTDDAYEWFELVLEYNISRGGNSGIMYHVTNQGGAAWATGPEFQLQDNLEAHDPTLCGWLYALYQPPQDPDTGMPIDATKPAGTWNQVRLVISPEECTHEINGVKYLSYQLGSDEFQNRVQASKFANMPLFAKPTTGMIALQGDHGVVSFRNVKLRPISE